MTSLGVEKRQGLRLLPGKSRDSALTTCQSSEYSVISCLGG
jgi:hypothetical protein